MQTYLVGGAVRDRLLGVPTGDRDFVVVGATPEQMEQQGFRRVGRQFPVFLHPRTGEEYALARTETKTGPGYRGFEVHASPDVTLEDDLRRRDLTINAMAEAPDGTVIDPWGGQRDLEARLLRHVSDAFREDPVRILRVARFAARLAGRGFSVAAETLALMREMVASGEAAHLVPERVWQEMELALGEPRPDVFITTLRDCGALAVLLPEVEVLFGVPQVARWHPEVDTGAHLLLTLQQVGARQAGAEVGYAVLTHDLGKAVTPREHWPKHHGHERHSQRLARRVSERLGVPTRFRDLAEHVACYHGVVHRAAELRPATILRLFKSVDALRRPERFELLLAACAADARGRTGREQDPYPQADYLRGALAAAARVTAADVAGEGHVGPAIGRALDRARVRAITQYRSMQQDN
jgi:tRNA nucleotidyltransferase (CCA-adding enzyme)